ncbi:MAG: endonuclease [Bacilli bacterium]|nr:endonuclease [Bacilli bacterium]
MKKKLYLLTLLTLILSGVPVSNQFEASALSARSINVTNLSSTGIRSYYAGLNQLSSTERQGDNLLKNLKPILENGHSTFYYATVWDWTKITDRDWTLSPLGQAELSNYAFTDNPYVRLLYRNDNGTATAAQHEDEHGRVIDREHVWPQSLGNFGKSSPAGTDLHHLILADSMNNQSGHSNYPYGNVNPSSYTPIDSYDNDDNPSNVGNYTGKRGSITYNGQTVTVYEPQNEDKGDIARAMFYMAARYSSYTSQSDPYLKLSDTPSEIVALTSGSSNPGKGGLLNTLLSWHTLDPVSDYEIMRNNLIYNNAQFNRNPFIDYPSWVDSVWGSKTPVNPTTDSVTQYGQQNSVTPTSISIEPSSLNLSVGQETSLSLSLIPLNASQSVTWSSSNSSVASVTNGTVTANSAGTATITATSTLNFNIKGTATITVTNQQVKTLTSISLSGVTDIIKFGETYPIEDIVVTATYSDSSTSDVTSLAIIDQPTTNKIGEQELTVQYHENIVTKYANFTVKVTNNGVVVGNAITKTSDLFISEYIEGSSNNKVIEIYNSTGSSVNLSDYKLRVHANGATSTTNLNLGSGMLANNDVYVIAHSSANATILSKADATSGSIAFNGNDAVSLYKVSTSTNIDIIGVIGTDPGTQWTGAAASGTGSTLNTTLVRTSTTTGPNSTFSWSEWNAYASDTTSYLGTHTLSHTSPGLSPLTQANAWAEYFLEATSIYCETETGFELVGDVWDALKEEYGYLASDSKTLFSTTASDPDGVGVAGAKARYFHLITKYHSLEQDNFLRDSNNNPIFNQKIGRLVSQNTNHYGALILITLSSISIFGYFLYDRKRKLN